MEFKLIIIVFFIFVSTLFSQDEFSLRIGVNKGKVFETGIGLVNAMENHGMFTIEVYTASIEFNSDKKILSYKISRIAEVFPLLGLDLSLQ